MSSNPNVLGRAGVMAGLIGALVVATGARADDTHYRGIPIGAHSVGLGGAFAGVADDVSAAYFNPAGLALGGTVGIAAGLSINAWERSDINNILEVPEGSASATTKVGRTLPIFVGAVVKFGPRDLYRERKFALGLSIVEPIFGSQGVLLKFRAPELEVSDSYRISLNDRATWYGISFASRLDLRQSIGASFYLSVRKNNHSENGLLLTEGTPIPGQEGALLGANTAANAQALSLKAFHFVLRFGWLNRIKPQVQLGVMLQLPGIPLRQTAESFSQGFVNDSTDPANPTVTRAYFVDQKVNANLPLPMEIEVGLEYWPAEVVMLAVDASFHGPVRGRSRVETDSTLPVGGFFFDNSTGRRAVGNVAIAGDFYIGKIVMIEAGFFTDLSSALKIPESPERYYQPRIHRLGGTLSVGFNVAGISLAVGSTVLYGRGQATGAAIDLNEFAGGYTRTDARSRIVYLHVTGATRAAEDVSTKAKDAIKERQQRKREEEEEERRRSQAEEAEEAAQADAAPEEPVGMEPLVSPDSNESP